MGAVGGEFAGTGFHGQRTALSHSFGALAASMGSGFAAGRKLRVLRCSRCLASVHTHTHSCLRCNAERPGLDAFLNALESQE